MKSKPITSLYIMVAKILRHMPLPAPKAKRKSKATRAESIARAAQRREGPTGLDAFAREVLRVVADFADNPQEQWDISFATIGAAAGIVSVKAVQRAVVRLAKAGWFTRTTLRVGARNETSTYKLNGDRIRSECQALGYEVAARGASETPRDPDGASETPWDGESDDPFIPPSHGASETPRHGASEAPPIPSHGASETKVGPGPERAIGPGPSVASLRPPSLASLAECSGPSAKADPEDQDLLSGGDRAGARDAQREPVPRFAVAALAELRLAGTIASDREELAFAADIAASLTAHRERNEGRDPIGGDARGIVSTAKLAAYKRSESRVHASVRAS